MCVWVARMLLFSAFDCELKHERFVRRQYRHAPAWFPKTSLNSLVTTCCRDLRLMKARCQRLNDSVCVVFRTSVYAAMCPDEHVEVCNETKKYPDQSTCEAYFQCVTIGTKPVRVQCTPGLVFDIYAGDCVEPNENFDCDYRCVTPPPTTADKQTTAIMTTAAMTTSRASTLTSSSIDTSAASRQVWHAKEWHTEAINATVPIYKEASWVKWILNLGHSALTKHPYWRKLTKIWSLVSLLKFFLAPMTTLSQKHQLLSHAALVSVMLASILKAIDVRTMICYTISWGCICLRVPRRYLI